MNEDFEQEVSNNGGESLGIEPMEVEDSGSDNMDGTVLKTPRMAHELSPMEFHESQILSEDLLGTDEFSTSLSGLCSEIEMSTLSNHNNTSTHDKPISMNDAMNQEGSLHSFLMDPLTSLGQMETFSDGNRDEEF
jgi:hypothetical protein